MNKLIVLILVCSLVVSSMGQAFSYSPDWGKNGKRADVPNQDFNHQIPDFKCVVNER